MAHYRAFIAFLFVSTLVSTCLSHNWLDTPVSRSNQQSTQTGCRVGGEGNPNCPGPCDKTLSQTTRAPISIQRGASITVKWNRHTHAGGFIRFAWSPKANSDSHSSFDAGVDRYVCKEVGGCGPSDPNDSGGSSTNGLLCTTTITVPLWLSNGDWTMQWAYFGGYYQAGDYYACVDYTITGGQTGSQTAAFFSGGDFTYPNQNVCKFYNTNQLHVCVIEPCTTGTFPLGAQKGAVAGFDGSP